LLPSAGLTSPVELRLRAGLYDELTGERVPTIYGEDAVDIGTCLLTP
jgi:hypothetical protein